MSGRVFGRAAPFTSTQPRDAYCATHYDAAPPIAYAFAKK